MISKLGQKFTDLFQRNMPDAFVFALTLTLITGIASIIWVDASPLKVLESWYAGFWTLLEFGMQMVLLIVTGYCIALSPIIGNIIDKSTKYIKTPKQVYVFVTLIGMLLSMISWGWVVITAVLARELALRIKGINYPFLIACVYFSMGSWVAGLSSSIPLLLNTEKNYLIEGGILPDTLATSYTLGSYLNIGMIFIYVVLAPIVMYLLIPNKKPLEIHDLIIEKNEKTKTEIKEEASNLRLPFKALSDQLNNSILLQYTIAFLGLSFIFYYFASRGLDLNLNIMIFVFIILGLFLHKTPIRYGIAMRRASGNVSDILYQFPFYAGIMGIMIHTGLGEELANLIASTATIESYPFYAYLMGGIVNFAIPSGGGEFAVIGPSMIEAVNVIGAGLPREQLTEMTARASLSIAYGESLTNLLQPFFLLLVLPVMGAGLKIQARDIMGYLVIPFILYFVLQSLMVVYFPL